LCPEKNETNSILYISLTNSNASLTFMSQYQYGLNARKQIDLDLLAYNRSQQQNRY